MGFRKYNFQILLRLILIIATCAIFFWIYPEEGYFVLKLNLVALVIIQIILFFRFLTRWQRDLNFFSNAVNHEDFSVSYRMIEKDDPYYPLYQLLNSVSHHVRQVKSEFVQQNQYFQYVVENAQVGLIAYESNGQVIIANKELHTLTGLSSIKHISDLQSIGRDFQESLKSLPLNTPKLINGGSGTLRLSARLSKFIIDGKEVYLLSLLNINSELQENELRSWQELISVLTHEIMNSISPIHSLNESMAKYLDKIQGNDDIVVKAKNSLDVINRRSQSLMNFVTRYRSVTNVPLPQLALIEVMGALTTVLSLLEEEMKDVDVNVDVKNTRVYADLPQVEQILINLIRNARQAMLNSTEKRLTITAIESGSHTQIYITDTGAGIPSEILDKIFIPFFTTRKEGSGIGLTLTRQIMQKHGGMIDVVGSTNSGTTFRLTFRNQP